MVTSLDIKKCILNLKKQKKIFKNIMYVYIEILDDLIATFNFLMIMYRMIDLSY